MNTPELVADCSACGGWFLADESSLAAERLLDRVLRRACRLIVAELWWYETLNVLRVAVGRGRLVKEAANKALYFIEEVPMETIHVDRIGRSIILDLAQRHQLSAYDATYLALAANRGIALLTADRHLLDLRSQYPWIVALADCHEPPATG